MGTFTRSLSAAGLLLALVAPARALAQACIGSALPERSRALEVVAGRSEYDLAVAVETNDLGIGYRANPAGLVAYSVEYLRRSGTDGGASIDGLSGLIALRIPRIPLPLLTVCARTGVAGARVSSDVSATSYTNMTLPFGLVLELPVPLRAGATLTPYVAPSLLLSRTSGEVLGLELDESGQGGAVEVGAGLRFTRFLLGGGYQSAGLPARLGTPAYPANSFFLRAGMLF